MEDLSSGETMSPKVFLCWTSAILITMLLYPWIFFVSFLSFFLGYYLLDVISRKLKQLVSSSSPETDKVEAYKLDPLLHPTPFKLGVDGLEESPVPSTGDKSETFLTCTVCDSDSCTRSDDGSGCKKVEYRTGTRDLCIDPLLDQAIARFCSTVFDYYISTSWAPFETRKQLKLAFKRLLTNFGQRLELTLVQDKKAVSFCEEKVIPLCIHYIDKIRDKCKRPSGSSRKTEAENKERINLERFANLKTRRLCRQLLEHNLPVEYQACKLWMELCVAVLADGVLWNLILLGRNRFPDLFCDLASKSKKTSKSATPVQTTMSYICLKASEFLIPRDSDSNVQSVANDSRTGSMSNVPLLLGSFLDPRNDLYQPDVISSRWRPNLDEILSERDLLYCLIQYLKGQQALEYLQAVLDDSPDGNEYCRSVLQLEYLPGFCRSKHFMETLGISQVDCALEAGNDSPGTRRKLGHTRSSSYGGGNSGIQIWKLGDPKAVDGLPLHSNSAVQSLGNECEAINVRPRRFSIEQVINKFLVSTASPPLQAQATEKPRRVGIHGKSYEDYATDEVASQLVLGNCDIYDSVSQTAILWVNRRQWMQPVLSGWAHVLRPYLKPHFDTLIKSQLDEHLSLKNCIFLINLITDAFLGVTNQSNTSEPDSKDLNSAASQKIESSQSSPLASVMCWLLNQFVDPESFAQAVKDNDDEIILFFVDLLDLLVNQLVSDALKLMCRPEEVKSSKR